MEDVAGLESAESLQEKCSTRDTVISCQRAAITSTSQVLRALAPPAGLIRTGLVSECVCLCLTEAPACRPTPLYGQPSWWGEEDYGSKVHTSDGPHAGGKRLIKINVPLPDAHFYNRTT